MNTGLKSYVDMRKEQFNTITFKTDGISQFLAYYMLILEAAFQFCLISKEVLENVSNNILSTLDTRFEDNDKLMANNMYALTVYLQTMDNINQLIILTTVSADKLFELSGDWFLSKVKNLKQKVFEIKLKSYSFCNLKIEQSWKDLLFLCDEVIYCFKFDTQCSLKKMHNNSLILQYSFIKDIPFGDNYLHTLETAITSFEKELSILEKLDTVAIINQLETVKEKELKAIHKANNEQIQKLNSKLDALDKKHKENLHKAQQINDTYDERFDELTAFDRNQFHLEHPELTDENEFENAFEQWQDSLPDNHYRLEFIDTITLNNEYLAEKKVILKKLDKAIKKADHQYLNSLSHQIDVSLENVIKIQSIIIRATTEVDFKIPKNYTELHKTVESTNLQDAVKLILSNFKSVLSDIEIKYLEEI